MTTTSMIQTIVNKYNYAFTMQNTDHTDNDRPTFQNDTCTYICTSRDKYHRADTGLMCKDQPLQPNNIYRLATNPVLVGSVNAK